MVEKIEYGGFDVLNVKMIFVQRCVMELNIWDARGRLGSGDVCMHVCVFWVFMAKMSVDGFYFR